MAKRSKSKDAVPRTETAPAEENPAPPESENTKIEWEKQPGSLPAAEEAVSRSEYLEAGSQESIIEAVSIEAAVTPEFEILEEIGKESLDALDELGREGLEATESAASSLPRPSGRSSPTRQATRRSPLKAALNSLAGLRGRKTLQPPFKFRPTMPVRPIPAFLSIS